MTRRATTGLVPRLFFFLVGVCVTLSPSAARANPLGWHEHDGFYLRLSLGPALFNVERETTREGSGSSVLFTGDNSSVGGLVGALEVSIGATPFDRVAIAGTVLTLHDDDAVLTLVDGSSVPLDSSLDVIVVAPTVDVFPDAGGGFHFGGGFGLAVVESSGSSPPGGVGGAALAHIGYGFWFDDDWSAGAYLRGMLGRVDGEHRSDGLVGRERDLVTGLTLALSVLYH